MRRMGATQDDLDQAREAMLVEARAHIEAHRITDYEVWEENWPCWEFFRRLETQWDHVPGFSRSRRKGLNYAGVRSHAWIAGVPRKQLAGWWPDIQEMEIAVLLADEAKRAAQQQRQEG